MTLKPPRVSPSAYNNRSLRRTLLALAVFAAGAHTTAAQVPATPTVRLSTAPTLTLTGAVDSNSPVVRGLVNGIETVHVLTSMAGAPSLATGRQLAALGAAVPVTFLTHPGYGVWMESVILDESGTWYGYYHNEIPAPADCGTTTRVIPRLGAARSSDNGATWEDLGIILEAPAGWHQCRTANQYFVGGVGDVSVVLDQDSKDLYLYFSQYSKYRQAQGVAIARLPWADRDAPAGKVTVFNDGAWLAPRAITHGDEDGAVHVEWRYPYGTALVTPTRPWHDQDSTTDAFWGASVHWNTSLRLYVMLLNRTKDEQFAQEGIYISFASRLDDPAAWTTPLKILNGGSWYPQVIGLEPGSGSDKQAGARARLFLGGRSTQFIEFGGR